MLVPFDVKIRSSRGERHITKHVDSVSWTMVHPGGYESANIRLYKPIEFTPDEVEMYAEVTISVGLNVVWAGTIEDLSASMDERGGVWELRPVGPYTMLEDRTIPIIYVDRDLEGWAKVYPSGELKSGDESHTDGLNESAPTPTIMLTIPEGTALTSGKSVTSQYNRLTETGQNLAVFDFSWDAGISSANYNVRGYTSGTHQVRSYAANTAGGSSSPAILGTTPIFAYGDKQPRVRFIATASTTATDDSWAGFKDIVVRATTYDKYGVEKSSGYVSTDRWIKASVVVADLLGRVMNLYDGTNAVIDSTSTNIDQLAYPDGATPRQILDDLEEIESGYYWAVWGKNYTGKYEFEYKAWPTQVQYELTTRDGFSSSGVTGEGLYNSVLVRWKDGKGNIKSTVRTSTVASLTAAGRTRQGFLDLSDNTGSLANSQKAGDEWLADRAFPKNAGTVKVSRPILDRINGRMVQPYEVRSGGLVMIQDIEANPDTLNPIGGLSGRDGKTIFRAVSASYDGNTNTTTLELDTFEPTIERTVARLQSELNAKRRR